MFVGGEDTVLVADDEGHDGTDTTANGAVVRETVITLLRDVELCRFTYLGAPVGE